MSYKQELQCLLQTRAEELLGNTRSSTYFDHIEVDVLKRKHESLNKRNATIVKVTSRGQIIREHTIDDEQRIDYIVHNQYLIKQKEHFYLEEDLDERRAIFQRGKIKGDGKIMQTEQRQSDKVNQSFRNTNGQRVSYNYNRREAVQYAETWWNRYNPKYKKFEVDCTNYVSQCVHAGGAPMTGYPNRSKGWWYRNNNWSFSWAVSHSFRWFLSGTSEGLEAKEVHNPSDLYLGDVICYDFEGDGRYDHSTIVVAKDNDDMPLVNAHSTNSRMRYWSYEDSYAYTPKIKYKFFHIIDG